MSIIPAEIPDAAHRPHERVLGAWTNGHKAEVYLVEDAAGGQMIRKCYRRGFFVTMLRECLVLRCLRRLDFVPKVIRLEPMRRVLVMSNMRGVRVLEWVLLRHGGPGVDIDKFASFHGLEVNEDVAAAFERFRQAGDPASLALRRAIWDSYGKLHRAGFVHGDPSPRNLVYDGRQVCLVDFDHSRPSLDPASIDFPRLQRWYGTAQLPNSPQRRRRA
jgi:serine/threonine protein kinase